ncbi:MAG: LolA-related protein, partial [Terriglobales bacterium]
AQLVQFLSLLERSMKWAARCGIALIGVLLSNYFAVAAAQELTTVTLQHLLQVKPQRDLRFTEVRESQWLEAPIQSSGVMRASAAGVEKRTEEPRRETWRILKDRMQLLDDTGPPKEILFRDVPAVAPLAGALLNIVSGDLAALEYNFQLTVAGNERLWTVQLKPLHAEVSRYLTRLDLQGSGSRLQTFVILEPQGNRTTTLLFYDE